MDSIYSISRKPWLSAMKVKGEADPMLASSMDRAEVMLLEAASPRTVYRFLPREELPASGFDIEKHLESCQRVALLAVTLGTGVDSLIRKYEISDVAMAVILDCGASVLVEQVCDSLEKEIKESLKDFATSRFSPGYGDYAIEYQRPVVELLDAGRRIGLTVTGDHLMIPRKSITAVIGLSDVPVKGRLAGCGQCLIKDKCTLKKEGKFCGDEF